ncbi:hypothetical protein B4U80_12731 [Leptotrombidium deliense]|uniref:Uncharacterized protein n=1 Tax=Leptotrombidium deliense TaxID=299467 RepID=A0A443SP84_9ACAR|nr:hypothetical protein B4U80_12731 [Leptotrombidium deliense]
MVNFKRKKKIAVKISNKFRQYYKSQLFCDFTLYIGDEAIKCHKLILAAVSPFFENWFKCDDNVSSFKVYNFSFEQIKALIDFVYTGHFSLKKKTDLKALISNANVFGIEINEEMLEVVKKDMESRPSSAELMPPPPQPQQTSSSQAVLSSRFVDLFGGDEENENENDPSMEMDAFLPYSQVIPPAQPDTNGQTNDDAPGDEFLPFSQVIEPNGNGNNTPTEPKTPVKFKCNVPGCKHSFPKERELLNHKRKYHEKKNFRCPVAACKKKFERGKMFADHMKEKHPDYVKERYAKRHPDHDKDDEEDDDTIISCTPDISVLKSEVDDSDNSQNIFK